MHFCVTNLQIVENAFLMNVEKKYSKNVLSVFEGAKRRQMIFTYRLFRFYQPLLILPTPPYPPIMYWVPKSIFFTHLTHSTQRLSHTHHHNFQQTCVTEAVLQTTLWSDLLNGTNYLPGVKFYCWVNVFALSICCFDEIPTSVKITVSLW